MVIIVIIIAGNILITAIIITNVSIIRDENCLSVYPSDAKDALKL